MSGETLTPKDQRVLDIVDQLGGGSPTEIGEAMGQPYHRASGHVAQSLRRLVAAGVLVRAESKQCGVQYARAEELP